MGRNAISYLVAVILVLGITLASVVVYMAATNYQFLTFQSLMNLDIRRTGESITIVEVHRTGFTIYYNNGITSTCVARLTIVERAATYTNPNCTPTILVKPENYGFIQISVTPTLSPGPYTFVIQNINGKLMTFRVTVR